MIKFSYPKNGMCPYFDAEDGRYYIADYRDGSKYIYNLEFVRHGYWRKYNCLKGFKLFVKAHKMELVDCFCGVLEYHYNGKYYFYELNKDFLVVRYMPIVILCGYETYKSCYDASVKYLSSRDNIQLSLLDC